MQMPVSGLESGSDSGSKLKSTTTVQKDKRQVFSRRAWNIFRVLASILVVYAARKTTSGFSSTKLTRGQIILHPCVSFDKPFQCGTLIAPLDYTNEEDSRDAKIAVIQYPAGGGKTPQEDILGSIILNPGGPGGSGLQQLANETRFGVPLVEYMEKIFDGKYNLVSFDPRGVGETWPRVECFKNESAQNFYYAMAHGHGFPSHHGPNTMNHEIGSFLAQQKLLADICQAGEEADILEFIGTTFVARDIQLLHRALGDEKLNYWGFSYGTVLGSTYADMFPEDCGHLVIDGVVDMPDYYSGKWTKNLKDTDSTFDYFFKECASSKEKCVLTKLDNNWNTLKSKVLSWADGLKTYPVPVAKVDPPQLITYSIFIGYLLEKLREPLLWPQVANNIYDAMVNNDYTGFASSYGVGEESETYFAIACSDSLSEPSAWTIENYETQLKPLIEDTPLFAASFVKSGLMCSGLWPIRSAERHFGSFNSTTNFPLLFIGNEMDPVTPARYADSTAAGFPNAVSVRRDGAGHCSYSQPSLCLDRILHNYFVRNELPEPGARCSVDTPIFL